MSFSVGDVVEIVGDVTSFARKNKGRICKIKKVQYDYVILEEDIAEGGCWNYEVRKEIISDNKEEEKSMAKVSEMAEKFLDADTKALVEAGFLTPSLEISTTGTVIRDAALFDLVRAEMVKLAKAKLKEETSKK